MHRYYFDHNATTPVAPEVIAVMAPCFAEVYGNASSIHYFGQQAKLALEALIPIVSDISAYKEVHDAIMTLERDLANLLDVELVTLFPETR